MLYFFFFFSSRRRHTRLQGDWSSDVCSSDLQRNGGSGRALGRGVKPSAASAATVSGRRRSVRARLTQQLRKRQPGRLGRSGERRVGEEGRSRWSPDHLKKKKRKRDRRRGCDI